MIKTFAKLTLGISALSLMAGAAMAQDATLTINGFGGAYDEAHHKCVINPFEEATGATVNVVTAYSADAFAQLRAQKDAPQFDVIHFSGGQEIVGAKEGLLSPIDPAFLSNAADLYDFAKANLEGGEGPAYQIAPIGLLYNTETAPKPLKSWADLLDPAYGDGLVLTDISNGYGMLGFLMLNKVEGGDLENIQPGLDAVTKLLENGASSITTLPPDCALFPERTGAGLKDDEHKLALCDHQPLDRGLWDFPDPDGHHPARNPVRFVDPHHSHKDIPTHADRGHVSVQKIA